MGGGGVREEKVKKLSVVFAIVFKQTKGELYRQNIGSLQCDGIVA